MDFQTADLCDRFAAELQIGESIFRDFGGRPRFAGQIATIKCFEDNSRVRDLTAEAGNGRVLVIDAGGSLRRAVIGDMLAKQAVDNGWSGVVVYGCIRDAFAIAQLPIGVKALATCPIRTDKRGEGQRDVPVRFAGVNFRQGDWLYADEDGLIVAPRALV
ncbi:MAG TPA: ribonuclease E activity regulator RraA [Steroidobacteraceae bacterium]|nr:ribonuclease E activity regulator RraA [Steroidobacteraceae bacterium]